MSLIQHNYRKVKFLVAIILLLFASEAYSQNYIFSLNPRRAYDKIYVEIWAKSLNANAPKLGYGSLVVQYNTKFLIPSAVQNLASTDSIRLINPSLTQAIESISSQFNSQNGYNAIASQSYTLGYYSLEITLDKLNTGGLVPSTAGRGSFLGKISFDIVGNPSATDLANLAWSKSTLPGDIRLFDFAGNDIESQVTFVDVPTSYTVTGLSIISPNNPSMVVDRDGAYAVLTGEYADGGYPIYFERSINPAEYTIPATNPPALDEDLAYLFQYSLDNGTNWKEIGRITETDRPSSSIANNPFYRSGDIFEPRAGANYIITTQNGTQINQTNFRMPLRVIWKKNPNYIERSEQARLRILKIAGGFGTNLISRQTENVFDVNDYSFILGRLFFLQLNGTNEYLKSKTNYSNSTQLTVEAWINLNEVRAAGSELAIVAQSGGPAASPVFGSSEGTWMMFLKDGTTPAFRAREILARGTAPNEIYLGEVVGSPINAVSAAAPLTSEHSKNWVHVAATVKDNVMSLYVNGELSDKLTNTNATDIRMMTTSQPIWIGVNPNGEIAANSYLPAGIKSVRIWRNALGQDDIRRLASGLSAPATIGTFDDLKKGLEIYYSFEGTHADIADDIYYQNGKNEIDLIKNGTTDNSAIIYRPDQPHVRITAPLANSGVLNKQGETTEIRWIGYGLGDIATTNSKDLEVEYSIDGGTSWHFVKNPAGAGLTGVNAPDIEATKANWTPFLNNEAAANLRTINPYYRDTWLRIRGTSDNTQSELNDISGPFTVAPYFAIRSLEGSQMIVRGDEAMNITGNSAFIEAWIRPYRFPDQTEAFFPILEKTDPVTNANHYSLRLLETGQIQFILTDAAGTARTATSNLSKPLVRPNSVDSDSSWTHIGVLFVRNGTTGPAEVRFYIDGAVQSGAELATTVGDAIDLLTANQYPLYIGSTPAASPTFVGELKEIRLWRAIPNNYSISGSEPTQLTNFVQAAQSVLASQLPSNLKTNLAAVYSFNGSSFAINGWDRAVAVSNSTPTYVRHFGTQVKFMAAKPFIKLVEPGFRESIENSNTDVRVRWVGNYYDGLGFIPGSVGLPPSLEFSIRGGGGNIVQPYQYVGSRYWQGNLVDAIKLPNDDRYRFTGTGTNIFYALSLDASKSDPDENNDGTFNDQGPLSASLTNARLRLSGRYQINGESGLLSSEGHLFTITPASNFTVRVLLEGYHRGGASGSTVNNLASSYERGGLKINLFRDNANEVGEYVAGPVESKQGFAERDPVHRNSGNNKFANANFIFTNLTNGNYWVLVEHLNHLPIMSRFPAPFQFTGDITTTWAIESGWDFLSWNGVDNNVLTNATANPWTGGLYAARGNAISTKTNPNYSTTGLIYNGGMLGTTSPLAAMVGGDVQRDGQINAADRVLVRQDDGSTNPRSDVTGDGFVNAVDRTITDRNFGKVSSLYDEQFMNNVPTIVRTAPSTLLDPFNVVSELDVELSNFFNNNAKLPKVEKYEKTSDKVQAGLSYKVSAEVKTSDKFVDVAMYIQNTGDVFALANCTFALTYNTSTLSFQSLMGSDSVIFQNKPNVGYANLRTAPNANVKEALTNVRTIEVDYDAFANLEGVNVPFTKTYLGTLRFAIKDARGSVSFAWHESKAVITTKAVDATKYGVFEVIPSFLLYKAEILSPNGGEKYPQKKVRTVKWTTDGTAKVNVEFTSNAGTTWTKLNSEPISVSTKELSWSTPEISSGFCLMRIIDVESGIELDRSNGYFSIVPNFAQIVRPATSDAVYRGGSTDKIIWTAQGPDCIKFEFSSDGGTTWKAALGNVAPDKGESSWKIPSVTTKTAVVRMLDCESNEELARSGYFKILFGNLVFSAPRQGETLIADKYYKVAWTYTNLTEFDMQLSVDGGTSWELINSNTKALNRSHTWLVPRKPTENAIIRGVWNGDGEMEYGRTGIFRIINFTSVDDDKMPNMRELYPNPATDKVFLNVSSKEQSQVNLSMIDLLGNVVKSELIYLEPGDNLLNFDISNLATGNYYFIIHSEGFKAIKEIKVVK